jgi:hypothetical protein
MIAAWADVEVRFQRSPCVSRATTGTLHRGRDGDFTSQHYFLLPGNNRNPRAREQKPTAQLSQVRHPALDEKLMTVIIESGRRHAERGFRPFNCNKIKDLEAEEELKP